MHNKRGVLITRPQGLAAPLIAQLNQIGVNVWHYPTLAIQFLSQDPAVLQAIANLNHATWQIFVSRPAVQAVLPQIVKTWSTLELSRLHFAAVGPGTARELAHFIGNNILYPSEGIGSLALLVALDAKIKDNENVRIWCGNEPTALLAQGLQARGIKTQSICCYQREKTPPPSQAIVEALQHGEIQDVVISSGNSMEHLMQSLPLASLNHCQWIVVSPRLEVLARKLGFTGQILVTEGADDLSVINAIKGSE